MSDEQLTMLLQDCSHRPELFNRISNILYENFGNLGSVPALLVTWVVMHYAFYYDTDGIRMFEFTPDKKKEEV